MPGDGFRMIASGTQNGFVGRENCFVRAKKWREKGPAGEPGVFPLEAADAGVRVLRRAATKLGAVPMPSNLSLAELDRRIAVLRDNIRQLIEQAAGASGGQNEERTADRIAQQTAELDKLVLEREELAGK
jgi:hypothetical protein